MPSFLSTAQRNSIDAVYDDMHDTFLRSFTVYLEVAQEQTGANFNPLYGGGLPYSFAGETTLTGIPASGRIQYVNKQNESEVAEGTNLEISEGMVRLKLDSINLANVVKAKRIQIDDAMWDVATDAKPIGPFDPNYYMIFLTREN